MINDTESAYVAGNLVALAHQLVSDIANAHARPSAVYRPALSRDGDQWCALYGEDLQSGSAGFGESPELAMVDFDENWRRKLGDIK